MAFLITDLSEEYRKAESVFLQKNRKLFESYIESKNDEVTEEQLIREGNEISSKKCTAYVDDCEEWVECPCDNYKVMN